VARHWPKDVRPGPGARAEARITRDGRDYRLDLQLWTPSPSADRSLTGSDCSALAEAAALLIALTFESEAAASPVAPTVAGTPTAARAEPSGDAESRAPAGDRLAPARGNPPPQQRAEPARRVGGAASTPADEASGASPEPRAGPDSRADRDAGDPVTLEPLALRLSAALRLDSGMLPQTPAIGLQARLGAQLARLHVALGMTYWAPAQTASERYPTAHLTGRGSVGDLTVGFALLELPVRLVPVLSLELGQLDMAARGIAAPAGSDVLWLAGGAGVESTFEPLPHLELGLELLGLVPWPPPRWLVRTPTGDVVAFRTAPLTLHLSLRIAYLFR
jgi:hypothetical protein